MFTFSKKNASLGPRTQVLFGIITFLAVGLLLTVTGCGGNNAVQNATAANTQVKIGDAPADSVIAFELTVTSVSLTSSSGSTVSVFSGSREIELAHLAATVEPMALSNVPAGTYTKASIGFNGAEVTYIPTTGTTPVEKHFTTSGTVDVTPASPVTIGTGSNVLSIDVNLAQSLTFDATGNVTAVSPVFNLSSVAVAAESEQDEESGEIEDAVGTVSAAPANNSFVLSLQMSGQSATFNVDANTSFSDGLTAFADIKQGMLLRVDATTGANGAFNAKKVELVEASGSEAEGFITATTSPLTSFTMVNTDGAGSGMTTANVGTTFTVNVAAGTKFRVNTDKIDLSGLSFVFGAATDLVKGQNVEVESAGAASAGAITAEKVTLSKQALSGTVSAAAITGTTGTFTLTLAADSAFAKITGVTSVTVYQQPGTELKGISLVTNSASVKVRGMLFWDGTNYQFVASRITTP
ncbi:MAG TPA: DUF5666 domain-containing protein [Candidatus Limnocylindrales bacterium]|nr:DUF5666 domain-containing protein [Candidatus Limnocylindrales bacterium]